MAKDVTPISSAQVTRAAWVNDAIQMVKFIEDNELILRENSYDEYEKLVLNAPSAEKLDRLYDILIDAAFNNSQDVIEKYLPIYIAEIERVESTEHRGTLKVLDAARNGLSSRKYEEAIKNLEEIAFDENAHAFTSIKALSIVGYLYGYTANTDHIVMTLQKMEAIAQKAPDHIVSKKEIVGLKGFLASHTNDPEEMVKYSAELMMLNYQNKSLIFGATSSENFTHLVMENGDTEAIDEIDAINQRIAHMTGNKYSIFRSYMKCGEYAVKHSKNNKALYCFDEAENYMSETSKSHIPYYLYSSIAYARDGQSEKARKNLEIGKTLVNDGSRTYFQKDLNLANSEVLHTEGLYSEAYNELRSYFTERISSQKKELGEVTQSLRFYSEEKAALLVEKTEALASREALQSSVITRQRILIFLSALLAIALTGFLYLQRLNAIRLDKARKKTVKANQDIRAEARTDQLTRIGNRRAFYEYCQAIWKNTDYKKLTLAVLDLDGFKLVNDTFGHEVGDLMIQETSSRISKALQGKGRIFRLGGDEFAIVFLSEDDSNLSLFKEHIRTALKEPVKSKAKSIDLNWSVGAVIVSGENQDPKIFLPRADYALYQAKEIRGPSFHIFSDKDLKNINHETQLAEEVIWNLETSSFTMFGQIIVKSNFGTYQPYGVEALIRAQTRSGEVLSPETFIGHAISAGKVTLFTKLTLIKSIKMFKESNLDCPLLFNLSRHQIIDRNALEAVTQALEETGFPPEQLIIELSERTLNQDLSSASNTLHAFKDLGIQLALDDFGSANTGFSSLLEFEIDVIKTDRTLLLGAMTSSRIRYLLSNLIEVCQNLNIVCIIEGLETPAEVSLVNSLGGNILQGYIYGRPEEIPKFRENLNWVDQNSTNSNSPNIRDQKKLA